MDLEQRDEGRAAKVRAVLVDAALAGIGDHQVAYASKFYDPTGALRAARLTWHLLDRMARNHWLAAWNAVCFPRLLHA
jgi:hypothetical protein